MEYLTSASKTETSNPYIVTVDNPTKKPLQAVIFGFNNYYNASNFGNNIKIKLSSPLGGTYSRLLAQSSNKPFRIGKWNISCNGKDNHFRGCLVLTVSQTDANGCIAIKPLQFYVNPLQFQSNIIESEKEIIIDGNVEVSMILPPKTSYQIMMFPSETVSLTRMLHRVLDIIKTPFQNTGKYGDDIIKMAENESISSDLKKPTFWQKLKQLFFDYENNYEKHPEEIGAKEADLEAGNSNAHL